jgi:hypothetical protein
MNETLATECVRCNFPLHPAPATAAPPPPEPVAPAPVAPAPVAPAPVAPAPVAPEAAAQPPAPGEPAARGFDPNIRRVRPIRPRPPRGPQQQMQMQLWLILGGVAVLLVLFTAWQGFRKNNVPAPAVEGAQAAQQQMADLARAELAKDSTNVNARIHLANVLYDTGNWSEAIVHYKSAMRSDPGRIETLVDLGVCYYNLAQPDEAIRLFEMALKLNSNHPVALFNLGIVAEGQNRLEAALKYYQRAMQAGPPEGMGEPLQAATQRVSAKLGGTAPPGGGATGR